MFFTNLQNNELSLYHKIIFAQDMSLSLTDILNSDLFKVVSHNGVYKIFPLFYCKNISCNNSDVKILENKCIITPSINDLFFNFTVDNTDIVIFEDVDLAYKDISDELSTSEFNNYIQNSNKLNRVILFIMYRFKFFYHIFAFKLFFF